MCVCTIVNAWNTLKQYTRTSEGTMAGSLEGEVGSWGAKDSEERLFYYVLFVFWVLCHEHILTLQNRFSKIKSFSWASTKAPVPLVSNHTGLMVVHSCWNSVSVFFRSQIHPKIKGTMLRWNKISYFSHAKKSYLCTRSNKGKSERRR